MLVTELDNAYPIVTKNIHRGDIILSIDGQNPLKNKMVMKWSSIEQASRITLLHHGHKKTISLISNDSTLSKIDVLPLGGEIFCLLIAGIIQIKCPNIKSAYLLKWLFIDIGIVFMSLGASIRGDIFGKLFINTGIILIPILFLHFLMRFFHEFSSKAIHLKYINVAYIIIGFLNVLQISYFSNRFANDIYRYSNQFVIPIFVLGLLIVFIYLVKTTLQRNTFPAHFKSILTVIWWSLIISFIPFTLLSFIPEIFNTFVIDPFYTGWFILFFPLSFFYLITAKKIYDVDVIVKRLILSICVSLVPSACILGILFLILQHQMNITEVLYIFTAIVTLLTLVFYSLEYVMPKLEKVIYPKKYYLQKMLDELARKLSSIQNLGDLRRLVLKNIIHVLDIHGVVVAFRFQHRLELIHEGDIHVEDVEQLLEQGETRHDTYMFYEINRNEEYTSYLVLNHKKNKTVMGTEDKKWIRLVISYLAVSIENIYLIHKLTLRLNELAASLPTGESAEEVVWFRKTMFDMQEKERFRIAFDIHDTTVQDILYVKRKLNPLLEQWSEDTPEYRELHAALEHLSVINTMLRQSSFEIYPYLLTRIGLVPSLRKLLHNESGLNDFEIHFTADGADAIEQTDNEFKLHLYRMVQELLNNSKKHAEAKHVYLDLNAANDAIRLNYTDDGIGFDPDKSRRKARFIDDVPVSGMGLQQLRSRVLYWQGELNIRSQHGEGTVVDIRFSDLVPVTFSLPQAE